MNRPPYTATDISLAIAGVLTAVLDLAAMFAPLPVDHLTRGFVINAVSAILGTIIFSFTAHRAIKHTVYTLRG